MPRAFSFNAFCALFALHGLGGTLPNVGAAANFTIDVVELLNGVVVVDADTSGGDTAVAVFLAGSEACNHGQSGKT